MVGGEYSGKPGDCETATKNCPKTTIRRTMMPSCCFQKRFMNNPASHYIPEKNLSVMGENI